MHLHCFDGGDGIFETIEGMCCNNVFHHIAPLLQSYLDFHALFGELDIPFDPTTDSDIQSESACDNESGNHSKKESFAPVGFAKFGWVVAPIS